MQANENRRRFWTLHRKMVLVVLVVGLIPLLSATRLSHDFARAALEDAAFESLAAIRDGRAHHITDYYNNIESQVIALAASSSVIEAAVELREAMSALPSELGWMASDDGDPASPDRDLAREDLARFYLEDFAGEYRVRTGEDAAAERLIPSGTEAVAAQYLYISLNPRSLGSKHLMDRPADDETTYGRLHARHHPVFRLFLDRFGFYDLFLTDSEGAIVYSVFKEVDFATNVFTGPYRDTGIADVVRRALASDRIGAAYVADNRFKLQNSGQRPIRGIL